MSGINVNLDGFFGSVFDMFTSLDDKTKQQTKQMKNYHMFLAWLLQI